MPHNRRIVLGRIDPAPRGRFQDSVPLSTHTRWPGEPLGDLPAVAARHGRQRFGYGPPDGEDIDQRTDPYIEGLDGPAPMIVSGDEGKKQYRYVYDDETGLVVRFEHRLSPQVEEIIERAKRPAKFASAGIVAGILIGAVLFGLVALNAMGAEEDE